MNTFTTTSYPEVAGLSIAGTYHESYATILSKDALDFLMALHQKFNARRLALLQERSRRQLEIDRGKMPNFLADTKDIRESDWTVAPLPPDLLDRRVEITGPC